MGGGGVPRGGPPNQTAYYVALVSILFLIVLLLCYFCYFFISKIRNYSEEETPTATPSASQPRPGAYPVQPVIRDSATAMAALCKQVPGAGRGTVFPTSTSPAALQTDTGEGIPMAAVPPTSPAPAPAPDKTPAPPPAAAPVACQPAAS